MNRARATNFAVHLYFMVPHQSASDFIVSCVPEGL